jgi:phosphatidylglycerol:prolipoprotein diacylglycerol transferase
VIVIDIDPVLLYVGGSPLVRWYGVMFVVGILTAVFVIIPFGERKGVSEDDFWSIFWPATVAGLVGARLYYVAQSDPLSYLSQPWRILATWEGGLAFYGAIFGAALAIVVVCRLRRINLWSVLDIGAVFAVIGQSFGRIGNIVNGDVVGYPTDLPWGFIYAHPNSFVPVQATELHGTMPFPIGTIAPAIAQAQGYVAYQPAAIYELIFNIVLLFVLWRLRFRLRTPGLLFVIWLILYSLGQIVIFTQRMNEVLFLGLKQAQLTAIVVIVACIPLLWYLLGREPDDGETEQIDEPELEQAATPESESAEG